MDKRQQAIAELKRQMHLARERLGPEGIKALENLARAQQQGMKQASFQPPKPAAPPPGMVPYDRAAAARALEIFLNNHGDPEGFEKKLRALLKKSSH